MQSATAADKIVTEEVRLEPEVRLFRPSLLKHCFSCSKTSLAANDFVVCG